MIIDAFEQAKQKVIQSDGNAYERDTKLLIPTQQLGKVLGIIMLICHTRKFGNTENPFNNILSKYVEKTKSQMVIINILNRAKPETGGKNLYSEESDILGLLQSLTIENNYFVIVTHHLRKAGDEDNIFNTINSMCFSRNELMKHCTERASALPR